MPESAGPTPGPADQAALAAGRRAARLAWRGVLGGALGGTALLALALWRVRTMLADAPASDRPVLTGGAYYVLMAGLLGGGFLAAGLTFVRLAPLSSLYRRLSLALAAGLGVLVSALLATLVHHAFGNGALLALAAGAAVGAAALLLRGDAGA